MKVAVDVGLDVRRLARVEGHGDIRIRIAGGEVAEARWNVVETPRFFEVMLKGKHYSMAPLLAARICGICSISHTLAGLRATERAFGVEVPPDAARLRLLAKHGETLQSHILSLFFLAAPDFLGVPSVLPLIDRSPEVVALGARLKGLGNQICELIAGRTTHPVSLQVGGVSRRPPRDQLATLRAELKRSLDEDLPAVADIVADFDLPAFARETEFVSLEGEAEYPFIGGRLVSSDGVSEDEDAYREMSNEYVVPDSTSKLCRLSRDSFAVGPLARFNNNARLLHREARALATRFGLESVCHEPFAAHVARLVECAHVVRDSIRLADELHDGPQDVELRAPVAPRAGEGVAAIEAPRGILYHRYVYGEDGRVRSADCVIPTTQNNANIHADLGPFVEHELSRGFTNQAELELRCSMLVRAYDPCISCSVH